MILTHFKVSKLHLIPIDRQDLIPKCLLSSCFATFHYSSRLSDCLKVVFLILSWFYLPSSNAMLIH